MQNIDAGRFIPWKKNKKRLRALTFRKISASAVKKPAYVYTRKFKQKTKAAVYGAAGILLRRCVTAE
jgi:hypothetical protein